MIWFILAYLAFHAFCGIYDYGRSFAYFQREYPTIAAESYWRDFWVCALLAVAGPGAILGSLSAGIYRPHHGFKWH